MLTPWIDASQVYGANANEAAGPGIAARSDWLRTHVGGRLKMDASPVGNLLPTRGTDPAAPYMDGGNGADFFVAGDIRADEQPSLTSMQTLFAREHNRLADRISATATDLRPPRRRATRPSSNGRARSSARKFSRSPTTSGCRPWA